MRTLEAIELLAGGYMRNLNGLRASPPRRHIVYLASAFPIVLMHCHVIDQIQRSLNGRLEDQLPCGLFKFENTTNLAAKRNLKLEERSTPKLLETGRSVVRCSTAN